MSGSKSYLEARGAYLYDHLFPSSRWILLELLHTHLGFLFTKFFLCLLVIISHYPVSYILWVNIPPEEYSLLVDTSV
jgi:hypothetical protein